MNQSISMESTFLFSMPSFLRGAARVLDLGSTFDEYNGTSEETAADMLAISMDWLQVGNDLADAMIL